MKKKKLILWIAVIAVILVFSSLIITNYTPSDKVKFGYMECLTLDKGEKRINPIDTLSLNEYAKYSYYDNTSLLLNRVLTGVNKTYISLSTRLAAQEYIKLMNADSLSVVYSSREYSFKENAYHAFFLKKGNTFIYRTIYNEPKVADMILFDITNIDSSKLVTFYNDTNYLNNKLSCD